MFSNEVIKQICEVADGIGVERAALLAVAEVESGGKAFAKVNGRAEPLIRFEGHYFDRRLPVARREAARKAGLAAPQAGKVANPSGQAARWALLARAAAIDAKAAHESVSWGIGQVMGAHWAWLGYASVDALVAEARGSVAGQVRLMLRYIDKAGLDAALRAHDWAAFARGYNGPDYKWHGYDSKLAAAYRKHAEATATTSDVTAEDEHTQPAGATPSAVLRSGMRGTQILQLQTMLAAHGFPVVTDGVFGNRTRTAVRRFQARQGLAVDGIVGERTLTALAVAPAPGGASAGFAARMAALSGRSPAS